MASRPSASDRSATWLLYGALGVAGCVALLLVAMVVSSVVWRGEPGPESKVAQKSVGTGKTASDESNTNVPPRSKENTPEPQETTTQSAQTFIAPNENADQPSEETEPDTTSTTTQVVVAPPPSMGWRGWPSDAPPPALAPFDDPTAKAHQEAWAKYLKVTSLANDNGPKIDLVLIPPGEFLMGSPTDEKDRQSDENHVQVTLTRPFYLGRTEVTQGQWKTVMGTTPWKGNDYVKEGPNYPATYVSWLDAVEFCRRLTGQERAAGRLPYGTEYRLPTEAEWECAGRAGTTTRYSFGDDENDLLEYAWYERNAGKKQETYAHQVGQKKPNPFSLYDVHGNVWEWCGDWYRDLLAGGVDPTGAGSGTLRVLRGGSFYVRASVTRSALRLLSQPWVRNSLVGFRAARTLPLSPITSLPLPP